MTASPLYKVGTWRGRPAVFTAPVERPGSRPGTTRITVGFPVAVVTDACAEPEKAAQMIVDALNLYSETGR
jgi:hypothetical protein